MTVCIQPVKTNHYYITNILNPKQPFLFMHLVHISETSKTFQTIWISRCWGPEILGKESGPDFPKINHIDKMQPPMHG